LPTLSGLSPTYPQALQQTVFQKKEEVNRRISVLIVDRSKHISPVVANRIINNRKDAESQRARLAEKGNNRKTQITQIDADS
jgi:ribosome-binding protein aMBF1 (putative translation factor)